MNVSPTLYSRDSTGKIRSFYMERDGDRYRSVTGIHGGSMVESGWTVALPTNVGKKNERLGEAQAAFEVDAEYKKKLKGGYFESIDDVDTGETLFPMLANKYKDLKKPLPFGEEPIWSQPKLDGIRNIGREHGNFSRTGEPTVTFPDMAKILKEVCFDYDVSFDGELYCHELAHDLPKINSMVRKKNPSAEDLAVASQLRYHNYDLIDHAHPDALFFERYRLLEEIYEERLSKYPEFFTIVPVEPITSQEDLDAAYDRWRAMQFEGQIIRLNGVYQIDKRSKFLLKRKEYTDREFVVADILEGKGNWAGAAKIVKYHNPFKEGDFFETGLKGEYEDNVQVLKEKDKYINGMGTVSYFKLSPYGVPVQGVTSVLHGGERTH